MNNHQIIQALKAICGKQSVIVDSQLMQSYTTDWRKRYSATALAIVFPGSSDQIQAIVNLCRNANVAIVPQGGNTSNCGSATPVANHYRPQIIINLGRMNRIFGIDRQNSCLHVEAGVTLQQVHEFACNNGFYFPLSIASQGSCQIGGNLATNAGGINVLKYGMIRDLTLGLRAIIPNGELIDQLYSLRKNNTYLDLKQLFIGSEGTLGVITEATLKLFPLPKNYLTILLGVDSVSKALHLLNRLQQATNNNVCAFEVIKSDSQLIYQEHFSEQALPFQDEWLILTEIEVIIPDELDWLVCCLSENDISLDRVIISNNLQERQNLWQIRESIPLAEKSHGYAAKHDISLPLSQIENFLQLNMPKLKQEVPDGYFSIFGHLGDGNLHYNFGVRGADLSQVSAIENKISKLVYQDVINLGGSISAEHGIGQAKKEWFKKFCPNPNYQLLRELKLFLDPQNIFNPGKIF